MSLRLLHEKLSAELGLKKQREEVIKSHIATMRESIDNLERTLLQENADQTASLSEIIGDAA